MPISTCYSCQGDYAWNWEEAFEKFGFNDGDGLVATSSVIEVLEEAGYTVKAESFSIHNTVITSIERPAEKTAKILPRGKVRAA